MGKGRSNIEGLDPESPRTLEACLHRGITIEELRPRDEKTFRRGMESAEFTHRRYDFFEKRRQDKIALVKSRRNDLVRKSERYEGPGGLSTGEKRALEEAAKQKAATIEIERKRVESIKRKQQQEIVRIAASRRVVVPSLPQYDSCPSDVISRPFDAPRRSGSTVPSGPGRRSRSSSGAAGRPPAWNSTGRS